MLSWQEQAPPSFVETVTKPGLERRVSAILLGFVGGNTDATLLTWSDSLSPWLAASVQPETADVRWGLEDQFLGE